MDGSIKWGQNRRRLICLNREMDEDQKEREEKRKEELTFQISSCPIPGSNSVSFWSPEMIYFISTILYLYGKICWAGWRQGGISYSLCVFQSYKFRDVSIWANFFKFVWVSTYASTHTSQNQELPSSLFLFFPLYPSFNPSWLKTKWHNAFLQKKA